MTKHPAVRSEADLLEHDGETAVVIGEYRERPKPVRGEAKGPPEYAVVELSDDLEVFLEVYATPAAERSEQERTRYDGERVRIVGTVYRHMPNIGQGPLEPCVVDIESIERADEHD